MNICKGTYDDGSPLYSAFPTTQKELFRIFHVYGIDAFVVKYGGMYDICFPGPKDQGGPVFIQTGAKSTQAFTAKRWLELADKHCPDRNRQEKDILWTEMKKYIEKETLP